MRPTKEALIRQACKNVELLEYHVVDLLSDETLQQQTTSNPDKVIYSLVNANQVDSKLFLTSHQFTNVVGTDIYIYIGNSQGQNAYQAILEDLSRARRIDDKLITFLKNECNDCLTEIDLKTELPEKIPDKIATIIEQAPNNLTYVLLTESLINKGIAEILFANDFSSIGDSHLFIYNKNTSGAQMVNRLEQESLTNI